MNEVEGAGNTPLHNAAYEGWAEGVDLLIELGAKKDASNNAGDRPWHWADNMGHEHIKALLTQARLLAVCLAELDRCVLTLVPVRRRAPRSTRARCWCRTMCPRSRCDCRSGVVSRHTLALPTPRCCAGLLRQGVLQGAPQAVRRLRRLALQGGRALRG